MAINTIAIALIEWCRQSLIFLSTNVASRIPTCISRSDYFSKSEFSCRISHAMQISCGSKAVFIYNVLIGRFDLPTIILRNFTRKAQKLERRNFLWFWSDQLKFPLGRVRIFRFNTGISFRGNVVSYRDYQMFY